MDLLTDEEYALRAQRNDKEAFGMLVGRYEQKLLRYGRKFLSTRQDIEDLVQDVFVNAYRNIQSFDASQRFSPWIYRIAHNAFVDGIRKNSRAAFTLPDLDTMLAYPVPDESAEKEREQHEMKIMIDKGLDRMSPKYREALILYYLEELSYREIADVLQVPVGTVGARVKRAKEELAKIYKTMNVEYGK
jgi:RNA polymerase sigma-70 factor, ECF subfamily